MDIFAHGLWTGAVYKLVRSLQRKKGKVELLSVKAAAFWGIFPDLFAFTHVFVVLIVGRFFGFDIPSFGPLQTGEPPHNGFWAFTLAQSLYNWSHSLIIFIVVFGLIWLLRKKPYFELSGWLLHVLIDIPTHSYKFYPTPLLWPISEWKFKDGISWGEPWFMKLNYLALAAVYGYVIGRFIYWRLIRSKMSKGQSQLE